MDISKLRTSGAECRGLLTGAALGILAFLALALLVPAAALAQMATVSQRVLRVAELNDLGFIRQFLDDQLINPRDPDFASAAFLDVTGDGFGTNDLLILYPSQEHFLLSEYLPERMTNILSAQNLATDYNLTTVRDLSRVIADEAEDEEDPKKALAGAMLRSLLVYYPAGNFEGYVSQVGEAVRISFWGYNDALWQFIPEATRCVQPDEDPLILVVHKQPQIQSYLDVDGCVVIQASTTGAEVSSRVCE